MADPMDGTVPHRIFNVELVMICLRKGTGRAEVTKECNHQAICRKKLAAISGVVFGFSQPTQTSSGR